MVRRQVPPGSGTISESDLQNIVKFHSRHQKCFVFLCAPILGESEQRTLSALQKQFMFRNISFLPVHNTAECVDCMATIAKVNSKSVSSVIVERCKNHTQSQQLIGDRFLGIIHQAGIRRCDSYMLADHCTCGSLSNLAKLTIDELVECGFDISTSKKMCAFFQKESDHDQC